MKEYMKEAMWIVDVAIMQRIAQVRLGHIVHFHDL